VPCADLGIVLVDHPAVTYTHAVFGALAEAGAVLVACGRGHQPEGVWLPLEGHTLLGERVRAQIATGAPLKKRIWQALVAAKLRQQGRVLEENGGEDRGLIPLAGRVRSGDPDNREAVGAQRYWGALFGRDFHRRREGAPPNPLLNYGYAVLRSATARAISGAGLLPALGVHHHHRANAFALADDLMEPYRPLVDRKVRRLADAGCGGDELTQETKRELLAVLMDVIPIGEVHTSVLLALHSTATSFWKAIDGRKPEALLLPAGLPQDDGETSEPDRSDGSALEDGVGLRDV
jgi:CRISPR-associated protein Cas1